MLAKGITLILASLQVLCLLSAQVFGQEPSSSAPKRLARIVYDGDLASLLSNLTETFDVTISFETVSPHQKSNVKIRVSDPTLEDVLNAIMQAEPRYQWRKEGNSVDFFPKKGSSPILDTIVENFQYNGVDWGQASYMLITMPELQSRMADLGLSCPDIKSAPQRKELNQFTIDIKGLTMRKALHKVARESGSRFWMFYRHGQQEKCYTITNWAG